MSWIILSLILGTSTLILQQISAYAQNEYDQNSLVLFAKVTGGDFQLSDTSVYDSYSNEYINILGTETIKNNPDQEKINEIAADLQFSGIQTLESDTRPCDFSTICYLLQVTAKFGFTGQEESHMVYWNSQSGEQYENITKVVNKIQSLRIN